MSELPETIWAWYFMPDKRSDFMQGGWTITEDTMEVAYRRADLPPTTAQIMADERVKAALEACKIIDDVIKEGHDDIRQMVLHFLTASKPARAALAAFKDATE